jgi:hypothetical protein
MAFPTVIPASLLALSLLASPSPAPATGPGPVSAGVEQCVPAVVQTERSATFTAQMTAVTGTQHMAIQMEIQERTPADPSFHTVTAPGLGVWSESETGVKIYKFVKQFTNLAAPADFRALVHYRWIDNRGRTIAHTQRRTPLCEQPAQPTQPASQQPAARMP